MDTQRHAGTVASLAFMTGGLLVWAAHFGLMYFLQSAVCTVAPASTTFLRVVAMALTVVALASLGWLAMRQSADPPPGDASAHLGRTIGLACTALSLPAIVWSVLPLVMLPACGPSAT